MITFNVTNEVKIWTSYLDRKITKLFKYLIYFILEANILHSFGLFFTPQAVNAKTSPFPFKIADSLQYVHAVLE